MVQKLNLDFSTLQPIEENEKLKKKNEGFFHNLFKTKKVKKESHILCLYAGTNGVLTPMMIQPKDGMFEVDGAIKHVRSDCKYTMMIGKDRIPTLIQRQQDLKPIGNKDWDDLPFEKKVAEVQDMAVRGIRTAEIVRSEGGGGKMDTKTIIILIVVGIIALAFLQKYI